MLVLALDTTTRAGGVALARDGELLLERAGDPDVTHGRRLPGDVIDALAAAGVSVADVDTWAVAIGPGSFTGLRVGIATVQGLAFTTERKVVPVPTLDAIAHGALAAAGGAPATLVGVVMDAYRGEVFSALYSSHAIHDGSDELLAGPSVGPLHDVPAQWHSVTGSRAIALAGDAADVSPFQRAGLEVKIVTVRRSVAGSVALLAFGRAHAAVLPHAIRPIYVRRPDAELARERSKR